MAEPEREPPAGRTFREVRPGRAEDPGVLKGPRRGAAFWLGGLACLLAGGGGALLAGTPLGGAAAQSPPPDEEPPPEEGPPPTEAPPAPAPGPAGPVPVLAYYYIWFDPRSWERAKTDYPALGRYSSDDPAVLRQHVRWAKGAGLRGFVVSWKDTPTLSRRLERLAGIAAEEGFKLAVIYQGLDFARAPLPAAQVGADLARFAERYAGPGGPGAAGGPGGVFDLFGKPLVVWSGTWEFSREDVAAVAAPLRERLLMLASERSLEGYARLADVVDGNAYYWSSGDPATTPGYRAKLAAMGQAAHARGGLWLAPAAAGFDARLIGGTRVIERRDGETLRQGMDAAARSSPDAVGLISWNEFSENSHVEPSERHSSRYLDVLADILGARAPPIPDFDSSVPGDTGRQLTGPIVLGGFASLIVAGQALISRRSWRRNRLLGTAAGQVTAGQVTAGQVTAGHVTTNGRATVGDLGRRS